jgi:hypothetical protein
MQFPIDLRAERISDSLALPLPDKDIRDLTFLMQMKSLAGLTAQYGSTTTNTDINQVHGLAVLTTEHIDPADFIAFELEVFGSNSGFERGSFAVTRCLPSKKEDPPRLFERAAKISVNSEGLIRLMAMTAYYPQTDQFESPLPNPLFGRPRQVVKEMFQGQSTHMLIQGPLTSLGPNTKEFIFGLTNDIYQQLSPNAPYSGLSN